MGSSVQWWREGFRWALWPCVERAGVEGALTDSLLSHQYVQVVGVVVLLRYPQGQHLLVQEESAQTLFAGLPLLLQLTFSERLLLKLTLLWAFLKRWWRQVSSDTWWRWSVVLYSFALMKNKRLELFFFFCRKLQATALAVPPIHSGLFSLFPPVVLSSHSCKDCCGVCVSLSPHLLGECLRLYLRVSYTFCCTGEIAITVSSADVCNAVPTAGRGCPTWKWTQIKTSNTESLKPS